MDTLPMDIKDKSSASSPGSALFVLNSSQTRYHVVRAAALKRGWLLEEEGCYDDIPEFFHSVPLRAARVSESLSSKLGSLGYAADSTPQVLWVDKSVARQRVAALKPHQRLNHFVGMDCIARKATLFTRLMCALDRCAATGLSGEKGHLTSLLDTMRRFYPRSFATGPGLSALAAHVRGGAKGFYIVKPNKGCQGKGILITQHPLEVLSGQGRAALGEGLLVQEYIDRPLCIGGRKFDVRLYVLITSIAAPARSRLRRGGGAHDAPTPMQGTTAEAPPPGLEGVRVFVHRRGLIRICADAYQPPDDNNVSCRSMHLTNYAVNKHSPKFAVGEASMCGGNKRDLDFLEAFLDSLPGRSSGANEGASSFQGNNPPCEGSLWARVKRRIDECVVLTVLSGLPVLRRELAGAAAMGGTRGDYRSNCFELLGFDILLREDDLEPVLMEVNHSPSLFCDTSFDFSVKHEVISDTFSLLETHITPLGELLCGGVPKHSLTKGHLNQGNSMSGYPTRHGSNAHSEAMPEEQLVRGGSVGFVQLLPQYVPHGGWTEEERQRQRAMLLLANGLP